MLILDNQYLKTAIELGLIGVVVLVAFFLVPLISALVARRRSGDPELRLLCAALAGAALAAGVCSLTFDSLSFPMFTNVHALVIGLIGACWRLAGAGKESATVRPVRDQSEVREPTIRSGRRTAEQVVARSRIAVMPGPRQLSLRRPGPASRAGPRARYSCRSGLPKT